ncbi:ferritin heavy chain-like [Oryx dammah]|uniref:ferritin heavy chain-like n=1 Tax=Oryx dammah TaxID=59534 RepID=UPI001A9B5D85|nr:ferritin heavy chain-like [Oryx dammah]
MPTHATSPLTNLKPRHRPRPTDAITCLSQRPATSHIWPGARLWPPTPSTLESFRGGGWRPRLRPHPRRFLPRRRLVPVRIPWVGEGPALLPTSPSQEHRNYRPECEAALNSHAALEFRASFQCQAVAFYLNHDDVGLKHFSSFFLLRSQEHSKTAESLMFLQIQRGGRICFLDIRKPETQQWESGLQAMQDTLQLENCVNQSLLDLHQLATDSSDTNLYQFLGTGYLDKQVKFIKELGDHVSNLRSPEGALAESFFDKLPLSDGTKKD